jgi:hypothetical protein
MVDFWEMDNQAMEVDAEKLSRTIEPIVFGNLKTKA